MLGGCTVYGSVPRAPCGEEACLLVFGEVVPYSFGLEVIQYRGEATLHGFDFMVQRLLEVEKRAWGLSSAGVAEGANPDVGGVKILEQVGCLFSFDGTKGRSLGKASLFEPFEGVGP